MIKKVIFFILLLLMSILIFHCRKKEVITQAENTEDADIQAIPPENMTHMASGWSTNADEALAVAEAVQMMQQGLAGFKPGLVTLYTTGGKYNNAKVYAGLKSRLAPGVRIWGLNSDRLGIITEAGRKEGISIMGIYSPDLVVGIGSYKLDWQDQAAYKEAGRALINAALKDAGKSAEEPPQVILFAGLHIITCTDMARGIEEVVGDVPIWGGNPGSEVENLVIGSGTTFSNAGAMTGTISLAAIWIKSKVGVAYGFGYTENTDLKAVVTRADPVQRIVYEIDHKPAADVYNEWIGGKLTDLIAKGGGEVDAAILGKYGVMKPVYRGSWEYVWVGFPIVYPDKSMFVTHEALYEGNEISPIVLSTEHELINKPAAIAAIAKNRGKISKQNVAGGFFIYCYANFYAARNEGYEVDAAFELFKTSIQDQPFNGFLAGGEVGYSAQGGNLMMACSTVILVFGKI